MCVTRARSVSIETVSFATASGVNAAWMSSGTILSPAIRFTIPNVSRVTSRRPRKYVAGERRYTMTIGVSCNAACTVAVPDAVTATAAEASTASVWPSTIAIAAGFRPPPTSNKRSSRFGARATTN